MHIKVPACVTSLSLEIVIVPFPPPAPRSARPSSSFVPLVIRQKGAHHSHQLANAAYDVYDFSPFNNNLLSRRSSHHHIDNDLNRQDSN